MTKRDQAQQIFNRDIQFSADNRQAIISLFIAELNMTPAGAATYYATCKKQAFGIESQPYTASKCDDRALYTICKIDNGVVLSTGSHFCLTSAKHTMTADDVLVKGLPDIGADVNTLQPL